MDFVTDFKQQINKNTTSCMNELNNVFHNIKSDKNKAFYKDINKYYTGMAIWVDLLNKDVKLKENKVLLDNILLDYCSILHCVVLGDVKLIKFLYRNIIESFARYITTELYSKEIDSIIKSICKELNSTRREIGLIYESQLKQIYNDACVYVHADINNMIPNLTTLINYKNNSEEVSLDTIKQDFSKVSRCMICLLIIIHKEMYINMKDNAKAYINEILTLEDRINIDKSIRG